MRPQSCKSKGRRLQQRVVADILQAFPSLDDDDCRSTSMGAGGEDVQLSPAARARLPLSLECKNVEKINVWQCLQQCAANAPPGATPCLVFSRNRAPTYAVVPWPELLALYARPPAPDQLPPRVAALVQELHALCAPGDAEA